ncbi:hypothetical protein BN85316990 [Paracholeplasma brassicae]|uniref:DUF4870 domain-containing protein n=1 Tax=Acholeplasma brassicae TaxID=61635 RepID=U4KQH1_9MOLU|nr:DUF4870 domain-containing protein [Paracholeplasma brassicae]CCV66720.1 hypothetical protein BN85316990 [Paracholeplasma brassicae]
MADFNLDRRTALVIGWATMFVPVLGLIASLSGYLYYEKKDAWLHDAFRVLLNTQISFFIIVVALWVGAFILAFIPFVGPLVLGLSWLVLVILYLYCVIKGLMYADKEELFVTPVTINIIK